MISFCWEHFFRKPMIKYDVHGERGRAGQYATTHSVAFGIIFVLFKKILHPMPFLLRQVLTPQWPEIVQFPGWTDFKTANGDRSTNFLSSTNKIPNTILCVLACWPAPAEWGPHFMAIYFYLIIYTPGYITAGGRNSRLRGKLNYLFKNRSWGFAAIRQLVQDSQVR